MPSMAVLAMLDPLNAENIVPPAAARRLSLPGKRPSHLSITSMVFVASLIGI